MEHSYTRDFRLLESSQTAMTRTLMIHRPPQCPSCHTHSHDERIDLEESYNPPIPSYNEESARKAMQESENIAITARNSASEEEDWEEKVNKFGWSVQQFKLFDRVARLLDMDRLARLTNTEKQHEPVHRRTVIDKSVSRLRQALASVSWETRLTQWLHVLLMENLPPCYLAIYIDILQTLHAKLPLLVNKMIFGSSLNVGQELLGPVLKKPWEPIVCHKNRKLPGQPYIVVVPSVPNFSQPTVRQQKWFSLLATMSSVIPIQGQPAKANMEKQTLQNLAENMVAITRAKIQQVRSSAPNRSIILVGFDAGASLAVQVALVESINCVICLGFSYNTYNGPRGTPDDQIVDIACPVLFVIGQNSARASHEEMEMLRERMSAQTSLVVVGSADECLRVSKTKRKIEGVTQSMVDNMVADEIAEFATNCLLNPVRPKISGSANQFTNRVNSLDSMEQGAPLSQRNDNDLSVQRKRKHTQDSKNDSKLQKKPYNRRSTKQMPPLDTARNVQQSSQEALDIAVQSILPATSEKHIKTEKVSTPMKKGNLQASTASDESVKYEIRESGNTQIISALASTPIILPALKRETVQTAMSANSGVPQPGNVNVKLMDSNQLIHLKPTAGTMQKFYSLKSSSKPVVSVMASNTAATIVSDSIIQQAEINSPTKFTIVRNMGSTPTVFNNLNDAEATNKSTKDLSETNIFDMPIVFADNDGVIQEGSPEKQKSATVTTLGGSSTSSNPDTNVSSAQPSNTRFVTLQQQTGGLPLAIRKPKQMINLFLNKGTLKSVDGSMIVPVGTKINLPISVVSSASNTVATTAATNTKFPKVILTKPLTTSASPGVAKNIGKLFPSSKVELLGRAGVKQTAVTGKPVTMTPGKIQSIVINPFNAKKIENATILKDKASESTNSGSIPIIGGNQIVIQTTASALTAANASNPLLGRNVTVKKLNIVSTSTGTKQNTTSDTVVKEK